jgi:hypothetical protein
MFFHHNLDKIIKKNRNNQNYNKIINLIINKNNNIHKFMEQSTIRIMPI